MRLFTELGKRNRDLTEALEQQTATSDILRVISRSPTDVQPVFDTIAAQRAAAVRRAASAPSFRFDGELIHVGALREVRRPRTTRGVRSTLSDAAEPRHGRRAGHPRRGAIVHDSRRAGGSRLRDRDVAVGGRLPQRARGAACCARASRSARSPSARRAPGPFPDTQVALLQTFADQAVIAIENVRLFTELEARNRDLTEALEQQTATSDILRVISQSPTDVQPVFDTIVAPAMKLCGAQFANVFTYDGELIHLASHRQRGPGVIEALQNSIRGRPAATPPSGRAIHDAAGRHDSRTSWTTADYAIGARAAGGFRSVLAVPLMREGSAIGGIAVGAPGAGPFPDTQIALLQTFADQAVIAIENVRLFNELEARNRDLTEALEQQTATSDILRVISQSQTDVQPVFDTIAQAA